MRTRKDILNQVREIQDDLIKELPSRIKLRKKDGSFKDFDFGELVNSIDIELSTRLKRTAGKAIKTGKIVLSYELFKHEKNREELNEVFRHEMAHILTFKFFGPGHGHDKTWKMMADACGSTGARCHKMEDGLKFVACPGCGFDLKFGPVQYKKLMRGQVYHHKRCNTSVVGEKGEVRPLTKEEENRLQTM